MEAPRQDAQKPEHQALQISASMLSIAAVALPIGLGEIDLAGMGAVFALTLLLLSRLAPDSSATLRTGIHIALGMGLGFIGMSCYAFGIGNVIAVYFSTLIVLMAASTLGANAAVAWSIPCFAVIGFTVLHPPEFVREVGPIGTLVTRTATLAGVLAYSVSFRRRQDRQADELYQQALTDSLTGLANRRQMENLLATAIAQADRFERHCAVVFVDVDGLKQINDRWGHEAGDEMIRLVAARIADSTRVSDKAARIGGDEFVVVLSEVPDEAGVESFSENLLQTVCCAAQIGDQTLTPSISLGAALYPDDAETAGGLLRKADAAMYAAKESGGGCVVFAG
ncbi:MAG: diguanylate cyclase [Myxococcota bacterium]